MDFHSKNYLDGSAEDEAIFLTEAAEGCLVLIFVVLFSFPEMALAGERKKKFSYKNTC